MATIADLQSDLETALGALSTAMPARAAGTADALRIDRSAYASAIRVTSAETVAAGSNLTISLATIEVDLLHRAAGSTPAELGAAEDALALLLPSVAAVSFWANLASVRSSPQPEVDVESDLERIGEVVRYTVRASCALEA